MLLTYTFLILFSNVIHQSFGGMEILFPEVWDGDKYQKANCPSENIPHWLDGYFVVQTAGSYGKQSDPFGEKLVHFFDGLGAITAFDIANGQVKLSARYYPSRSYKIWDFYNRDMTQSKVAWVPFQSLYNATALETWKNIPLYLNDSIFQSHPNVDFWRIGHQVIGATETSGIGMAFDPDTLTNFKHPSLIEASDIYKYQSTIIPLSCPVHERINPDSVLYSACAAFDPVNNKMFQLVNKITPDGTRTVEGTYEMGTYDPTKCAEDGRYTGDMKVLANFMHSITSTQKYVILPLTSIAINPCKLFPLSDKLNLSAQSNLPAGLKQNLDIFEYSTDVPMRFLVFDKASKTFVTEKPIEVNAPMTPIHQFNAYEDTDGSLKVDLAASDGVNGKVYSLFTVENMMHGIGKAFRLLRFRINLPTQSVNYTNVLNGQDYVDGEFPQINQKYQEKKYKYAYMMTGFLMPGSKISKIEMDTGTVIGEFSAPNNRQPGTIFREPWFVPRPGSVDEDDGVILVLGADVNHAVSTLYVVDARTMHLAGAAELPTVVPLGLHNRFFYRTDLGMTPSTNGNGNGQSIVTNGFINGNNGRGNGQAQPVLYSAGQMSPFEEAYWRQRQNGNLP